MSISRLFVFCYLPGEAEAVPAGVFEHDDQTAIGMFHYGDKYLERRNSLSVDCVALPFGELPLPVELNGGLYGAFRDSSPDYWGRLVIASRLHAPVESVSEIDYLLQANATRVGNLDFRLSLDSAEPKLSPPQYQDIEDLLDASNELEQGNLVNERIRFMLEQGSSLGGARPKCTVELDGELWLAKFPSKNDRISMPRAEYATMKLAGLCGLNVPELRLTQVGERDVFLIRRFDRLAIKDGWERQGFISGLSFAEWDERDRIHWSYRTLADRIRRYSVNVTLDLRELFLRIAFNILVRNSDDHPRNHGFLVEKDGLSLSPLFDVVPALTRVGVGTEFYLAMGIGEKGRLATLDNLCSVSTVFNIKKSEAQELLDIMRSKVTLSWKKMFLDAGFSDSDLDVIAPSF
jgi:serine/threonine-protein kinase HipA